MRYYGKNALVVLMVAALLLAVLLLGCGGGEKGKVTIRIGVISDLTGPASSSLVPWTWALQDLVRYINEKEPVPGAELKVDIWNNQMSPSRDLPGYDWLKATGAKVIFGALDITALALKPFAEKDRIPVLGTMVDRVAVAPPGWVFATSNLRDWLPSAGLEWISDHWDYEQGVPKIGFIEYYAESGSMSSQKLKEYCQAHPDKYEYVGGSLVPTTALVVMSSDVKRLKDCDWISMQTPAGMVIASVAGQIQNLGYKARIFGGGNLGAFTGYIVDAVGYEAIDKAFFVQCQGFWSDPYPIADQARRILYDYRPGDAQDIIHSGSGYLGGFVSHYFYLQILRAAIEEVGAENFDGQAFYNTAVTFEMTMEGFPEWGFSDSDRVAPHHYKVYQLNAEAEEIVAISDWLPFSED